MTNISWEWVVLISTLSFCVGVIVYVLNERIGRRQRIVETTELVIEACIRYGYIEDSRSEGDYDLNVNRKGTKEVRKILEELT